MENKKKYVYYMQPSMAEEMELMLGEANATSKSDFINIAVRFYLDYLHNKKSVDFISPINSLSPRVARFQKRMITVHRN